jgi:integrative and conjugative element protein (TIGR02256 family)
LAKILGKGGCKELTLVDFDIIESGNICRAEFPLHHTGLSKVKSLAQSLMEISPFIQVDIALTVGKALWNTSEFKQIKYNLNHFDIIFDCSTDNEMAFMLDEMALPAKIFNLSITDKAKEFICITNKNISLFKHYVASSLNVQSPTLYVGAGCQYPTFEASYLDINALLFNGLKYIQRSLENKLPPKSFIMEQDELDLKVYPFETYQLIDSQLKLIVSQKWIDYIKNQSIEHFPNEFGGILVGYYMNDTTLFVSNIFTPQQVSTSPNAYTRYAEDVNVYLETIYHETDGALVYVGEWHSHPNSSSAFSQKDFKTMQSIANDSNTNNKNPILLINGFNIRQHDISIYIFKQNKLLKYEKI